MRKIRTGISAHCFKDFDPEIHLPLLAQRGVTLFEIAVSQYTACRDDTQFARLRELLDENNIAVNSMHMPYSDPDPPHGFLDFSSQDAAIREKSLAVAAWCAARLAQAGGKYLVIHPSGNLDEDADRTGHVERCAETLWQLRERLPAGVQIAIEILPRTMLCRDVGETLSLLELLDDAAFGLCLDVNHIFRESIPEAMTAYAPRTLTTHISDHDGVDERHWLPGKGVIPWPVLIETLLAGGYTGPFIYETGDPGGSTPAESADILIANMREIFLAGPEDA